MTPDTELILGGGTLLSTRTYIAQIQVSDLLESRITEFIIPTKISGLSIMAGVSGAAIGKSAETPGILEVAWPIVAPNFYPVGAIYMSTSDTSPATLFGGTWEAISGRVLVGYDASDTDFDTIGKTGGSKTHTLTINEMPAHKHSVRVNKNPGGSYAAANWTYGTAYSGTEPDSMLNMGGGQPFNIMNPYKVVYMWERTA